MLAILAALIFLTTGNAQTSRQPLTKQEVVELLRNSVPPPRVEALARQYGIAFELTSEAEKELREVGATEALLKALRELPPSSVTHTTGSPILVIESTPGGAQVYVDDELMGTTSSEGRLKVPRLSPGEHRLRLSHAAYQDFEQKLGLEAGETVRIIAKLDALKPAAPEPTVSPPAKPEPSVAPSAEQQSEVFERIAQAVSPSIVHIRGTQSVPVAHRATDASLAQQPRQTALGSGVLVSADGHIVTNQHVVAGSNVIEVTLADRRVLAASLVGTDSQTDLAVLKVDGNNLPTLAWGDSSTLRPGATVMAFGNPLGTNPTVTRGSVSAVGGFGQSATSSMEFIQTDADINPGNSGGALVNLRGEVVGINTAIIVAPAASGQAHRRGPGFAVPSNLARQVVESIIKTGRVRRTYLGIAMSPLTRELASQFGLPDAAGALVHEVQRGSPGELAGLKANDVIRTCNGLPIDSPERLRAQVSVSSPGATMTLGIVRNGRLLSVQVTLGER